jgi:hypothetical protein
MTDHVIDPAVLQTKVLILDDDEAFSGRLKVICENSGLIGIKPSQASVSAALAILGSNVDLGGVMLYEHYIEAAKAFDLAREIRAIRPELPIFLRRDNEDCFSSVPEKDAVLFAVGYTANTVSSFQDRLKSNIFSRSYPNALVRGITEMTTAALETLFKGAVISVDSPYLVSDRIIYGEVFSLISLETGWCRGYMMLQADENEALGLLEVNNATGQKLNFRELNSVLGEATNMIWGAFKNRYAGFQDSMPAATATQVPIIINHARKYISFGSDDPQLCLKYTVSLNNGTDVVRVPVYQRFVFNLTWAPEAFSENISVEDLVDSGELELF